MLNFIRKIRASASTRNPRLAAVSAVVAILTAVAYLVVSGSEPEHSESRLAGIPINGESVQGSSPVSEEYRKKLNQADNRRAGDAWQSGTSALPTIVSASEAADSHESVMEPAVKPLSRATEPKEPLTPVLKVPQVAAAGMDSSEQKQQDAERIGQLAEYISSLHKEYSAARTEHMPLDAGGTMAAEPAPIGISVRSAVTSRPEEPDFDTPLPGTVVFGQLTGRINSDSPGPVLAEILQGKLAGARLIGRFETGRDSVVIRFDRMTLESDEVRKTGRTFPINAVAVDARHMGMPLPTQVNRHIMQNVAVGFASGFARGLGGALSQFGGTTRTGSDGSITTVADRLNLLESVHTAAGQAVSDTGSVLQDSFGNRPATITMEAGTPIGVLFL